MAKYTKHATSKFNESIFSDAIPTLLKRLLVSRPLIKQCTISAIYLSLTTISCSLEKNGPAHAILLLIAPVSNQGSDEPAHPRSLGSAALVARIQKVWK